MNRPPSVHTLGLLCPLLALGCSRPPPEPSAPIAPRTAATASSPQPVPPSALTHDLGAPIQASWVVVPAPVGATQQTDPTHQLLARITSPGDLGLPLSVYIEVPTGATLVAGPQRYTVPAMRPGETHTTAITVRTVGVPADDLILVVDAQADDRGVHARIPYRFGRPEPTPPALPLDRRPIQVGPLTLGAGVQMPPETAR